MSHITNKPPADPPPEQNEPLDADVARLSRWRSVRRSAGGRILAGLVVGGSIGGCWLGLEALGGLHLLILPLVVEGWLIARAGCPGNLDFRLSP